MHSYYCVNCGATTVSNRKYDIFPCPECCHKIFLNSDSENFYDPDDYAVVPIGGHLRDHFILCSYYKEQEEIHIVKSWMIHNNYIREFTLSDYCYQVACDALSGL